MGKQELIKRIAKEAWVSKKVTEWVIWTMIWVITKEVSKWNKIQITWFWSFERVSLKSRKWVNPKTWEKIQIPAMNRPKFKAWKTFKETVKA